MFEWENKYAPKYEQYRDDDTSYIIGDAVEHDYTEVFSGLRVPKVIDYLQIDLEPGMLTPLQLLIKLNEQVMDDHKFATITFEHDIYCGQPNSRHNVGGPWNGWQPYPSSNFQKVQTESRKYPSFLNLFILRTNLSCPAAPLYLIVVIIEPH